MRAELSPCAFSHSCEYKWYAARFSSSAECSFIQALLPLPHLYLRWIQLPRRRRNDSAAARGTTTGLSFQLDKPTRGDTTRQGKLRSLMRVNTPCFFSIEKNLTLFDSLSLCVPNLPRLYFGFSRAANTAEQSFRREPAGPWLRNPSHRRDKTALFASRNLAFYIRIQRRLDP